IARSKNHEIALDQGKIDVMDKVMTMGILFLMTLILLEISDRGMNTLIAFGGVGGIAIAFASQEIISSFFGGLMIYLNQPFAVGECVNIPERNIEGNVEEIGWYKTKIRTFKKRPIYITNSMFSKIVVVNPSRMSHRQFKEKIGLRYQDLPVIKVIMEEL